MQFESLTSGCSSFRFTDWTLVAVIVAVPAWYQPWLRWKSTSVESVITQLPPFPAFSRASRVALVGSLRAFCPAARAARYRALALVIALSSSAVQADDVVGELVGVGTVDAPAEVGAGVTRPASGEPLQAASSRAPHRTAAPTSDRRIVNGQLRSIGCCTRCKAAIQRVSYRRLIHRGCSNLRPSLRMLRAQLAAIAAVAGRDLGVQQVVVRSVAGLRELAAARTRRTSAKAALIVSFVELVPRTVAASSRSSSSMSISVSVIALLLLPTRCPDG